jgi:hypothetical protein
MGGERVTDRGRTKIKLGWKNLIQTHQYEILSKSIQYFWIWNMRADDTENDFS